MNMLIKKKKMVSYHVCNQVLEEIAQRAANIHPPAGVSQGSTQEAFLKQRPPSFRGSTDPLEV